jgi:hypothetical protein
MNVHHATQTSCKLPPTHGACTLLSMGPAASFAPPHMVLSGATCKKYSPKLQTKHMHAYARVAHLARE